MAWLDSFQYEKAVDIFNCSEGDHAVCIKAVKQETSQKGNAMLVFYCNVKDEHWNGVQLRLFAMEGQYFDRQLSRLCDCFGVIHTQATNLNNWVNKIGMVRFDHWKYNSETKKNETVAELQNHILPKQDFKQPDIVEPVSQAETKQDFGEDIPF